MARPTSLSGASNTVAVHLQADFPEATTLFSRFGDIARLDTTLSAVTGLVFVTFFDVRVAQKVLQHFGALAEPYPSAARDFRAVSISPKVIADLRDQVGQLHGYGEIAGISLCEEEIAVEFYDMRAAQRVTMLIPASRPICQVSQAAAQGQEIQGQSSQIPEPFCDSAESLPPAEWVQEPLGLASVPLTSKESETPATPPSKGGRKWQGNGKPVREKMGMEDLQKFDIVPDKIRSGEDTRTTVMVRNIPKELRLTKCLTFVGPAAVSKG